VKFTISTPYITEAAFDPTGEHSESSFSPDGRYLIAPHKSNARIYDCPECMKEERLPDFIDQRVSAEALHELKSKKH
jgi:hypothetical protein